MKTVAELSHLSNLEFSTHSELKSTTIYADCLKSDLVKYLKRYAESRKLGLKFDSVYAESKIKEIEANISLTKGEIIDKVF